MNTSPSLIQLMRWFGPSDAVTLDHIAQAGCSGVVSALHHIPIGDIWRIDEIQAYQSIIKAKGLNWTVVESLPVHENIKRRSGDYRLFINNYQQSLHNLAQCGIKVVTYNFMPVLDWVRTDSAYCLPDGSETLRFDQADLAAFDLFLLKRPGAESDYSLPELLKYTSYFQSMDRQHQARLCKHVLLGLPGTKEQFEPAQVLEQLQTYAKIDRAQLKRNLIQFLEAICPVAEEVGIQLAIHPDDPPFSVLGLPRVMSTNEDIKDIMAAVPSPANGLCFCTGSFGARKGNDLVEMIKNWGSKIYFLHLRNTKRDPEGNFEEAPHLEGDTDMYACMQAIVKRMHKERRAIPMRPDHGYNILDDLNKDLYPGYSVIGRLKGLAELRGLEYAVSRSLFQHD